MQQQPLEDRVTSLETADERHRQNLARLDSIIEHQDQLLDRLIASQEFLQANLITQQAKQEAFESTQARIAGLLTTLQAKQGTFESTQARMQDNQERIAGLLITLQAKQGTFESTQERIQDTQGTFQAKQEAFEASQERIQASQERVSSLLDEISREAAATRRFWLRLAQRYGWIDDELNGNQPETPA